MSRPQLAASHHRDARRSLRRAHAPLCDLLRVSTRANAFSAVLSCALLCATLTLFLALTGRNAFARIPIPQDPGPSQPASPEDYAARKAADRGDKADASGKTEEAWRDYQEAAQKSPKNHALLEREAALRSKVIRQHAEAAEHFALTGRLVDATAELNKGLRIDPGNTVLAQRLLEMKSLDDELPAQPDLPDDFPREKPQPGKRTFNIRGDTRNAYEQIAQQFGLQVSFDNDLASRPVKFRATDVDFKTAMTILGTETATFYRPLNDKLIYVAPNTTEKRKQYAILGEATFPLPNSVANEDMTELLRALRELTGSTHMDLNAAARAITMRDTPERLALAREIIQQAEHARGEVLLEIELLEVDTGKARNLGLTTPFPLQATVLTPQQITALAASSTAASALTALASILTGNGISNATSILPFGGGDSTFLVTLGSVAANFSDSLSVLRSGREVLLRAQSGKPATFFVGDRYPITLSLLSGSLAGGSATTNNIALTGLANFSPTSFPLTQFSVGANPTALAANFFTNGTLPDLAVVYNNATNTSFTILQNQDNGNFLTVSTPPITLGPNEVGQVAIGTGVFRNDTTKFPTPQADDLVLVNSVSNTISILLGNGDGTFVEAPNSPIAVGKNPSAVVVQDFNNDGFLDLAVANETDNTISLFRGNGDGTFTEFPASPFMLQNTPASGSSTQVIENAPVALAAGFLGNAPNQSNQTDLAILTQNPTTTSGSVVIWLTSVDPATQNVTFTQAALSPIAVGNTPTAIATGDFNADGFTDFAVVNQADATISVFIANTSDDGTFSPATNSPFTVGATSPTGIVAASFSGGSTPDLAVTNQGSSTLSFFVANGDGTFTAGGLLAQGVQLSVPAGPTAIITSDLSTSNNSLPDVAFLAAGATSGSGVVGVLLDSSAFAASNNGTAGQTPYPGSEFEDLGIKVKATPTLHPNHEVTLQLEFEIRALANATINGIPILTNRTLNQTVRLREDEPTILGGLSDREETKSITGLPGFAEIPGPPGYAFGDHTNNYQDTELLFVITPRELLPPKHDARSIYAGRGEPQGQGNVSTGGGRPDFGRQPQQPGENPPANPAALPQAAPPSSLPVQPGAAPQQTPPGEQQPAAPPQQPSPPPNQPQPDPPTQQPPNR